MSGRGGANSSYSLSAAHPGVTAHLFANSPSGGVAGAWADLTDPWDAAGAGESAASADSGAGGSPWPLLATKIVANGMPCAFVPACLGGTGIAAFAKTAGLSMSTLYGYAASRLIATGAKYALFYMGESDALSGRTTAAEEADLNTLVNNLWNDCGVITIIGRTHYWGSVSAAAVDAIRQAQYNVATTNAHALLGPDLAGANTGNDIHFLSASELQTVADRWYDSLSSWGLTGSSPVSTLVGTLAAVSGTLAASVSPSSVLGGSLSDVGSGLAASVSPKAQMSGTLDIVSGALTASVSPVSVMGGTLEPITSGITSGAGSTATIGGSLGDVLSTLTAKASPIAELQGSTADISSALTATSGPSGVLFGALELIVSGMSAYVTPQATLQGSTANILSSLRSVSGEVTNDTPSNMTAGVRRIVAFRCNIRA